LLHGNIHFTKPIYKKELTYNNLKDNRQNGKILKMISLFLKVARPSDKTIEDIAEAVLNP
jgi:hypothetical protein